MKKPLSAAIALGVAAAFVLAGASAATAAAPDTLPSGQKLYAIDCDDFGPQLWSVGANGASTPVGNAYDADTGSGCAGGAQTNPVDGITYFIYYPFESATALAKVDLTTGAVETIANLSGGTRNAYSMAITNSGEAFVVESEILYRISLTTGVTTTVGPTGVFSGPLGYDGRTDTIYLFANSSEVHVYTIDRTTGDATDTDFGGSWPITDCLAGGTGPGAPNSVTFDSAGFAWILSNWCSSDIMSFDLTTRDAATYGELNDPSEEYYSSATNTFYSNSLFFGTAEVVAADAAAPALAATGFNSGALAIAGGIGAIVILLGAALLFRSRRKA